LRSVLGSVEHSSMDKCPFCSSTDIVYILNVATKYVDNAGSSWRSRPWWQKQVS